MAVYEKQGMRDTGGEMGEQFFSNIAKLKDNHGSAVGGRWMFFFIIFFLLFVVYVAWLKPTYLD
jgi:hypothetical protein